MAGTGGSSGKLTRCERHGIYYDASSGTICPRCFDEAEASNRPGGTSSAGQAKQGRGFPILPLLVLLLAGGGVGYWWMHRPTRPPPEPLFGLPGAASGISLRPLDPAPFKSEITALESVLYNPKPPDLLTPGRIGEAARALGQAVIRRGPKVMAQQAGSHILGFANQMSATEDVGYSLADLGRARTEWEKVRSAAFQGASWFRQSTPGLTTAQTPTRPKADPRLLRQLTDWSLAIERALRFGRAEVDRYGEIGVDVAERSREARELYDRWTSFARQWNQRMTTVNRMAPPQPAPGSEPSARMAYQYLGRAAHELQMLPQSANDYGVPFKSERRMRLDQAERELQNARKELTRARK